MAATTSAGGAPFAVLPVIGYVLLAVVLAYLALRAFRYFRGAGASRATLPKPVSGAARKGFGFARSTGWDWARWSSLVPRVPAWSKAVPEIVKGKAKAVATAKNLSVGVELLPTTGLPPPPTAVPATPPPKPTSTPQLVDLSTPPTPPLTTGATSTTASFPTSPRTPSPPFPMHALSTSTSTNMSTNMNLNMNMTSKPLYPPPSLARPSSPRPPSPHALLATTPPPSTPHRRSRSLGGVPIRRVSSWGRSGLRNAVELRDLSSSPAPTPAHTRGTSGEHLLIDFVSSGSSSSEEEEQDDRARYGYGADEEPTYKISPAASDIGVLPLPPAGLGKEVDARTVGHHVPLVDLTNDVADATVNEDGWKWFAPGAVPVQSLSFGRGVGSFLGSAIAPKRQQVPRFPQAEKLVDVEVDSDDRASSLVSELVSGSAAASAVVVHRTEVHPQPPLVDLSNTLPENPLPLVDLHDDEDLPLAQVLSGSKRDAQLVDVQVEDLEQQSTTTTTTTTTTERAFARPAYPPPPLLPSTAPLVVNAPFAHPLQDLVAVVGPEPKVQAVHVPLPQPESETVVVAAGRDDKPGLLFAGSKAASETKPTWEPVAADIVQEEPTQDFTSPASADSEVFEYPSTSSTAADPASSSLQAIEPPSPLLIPLSETEEQGTSQSQSQSLTSASWGWDDLEDPWGTHVPGVEVEVEDGTNVEMDASSPDSEVFVYVGKDAVPAAQEALDKDEEERRVEGDLITFVEGDTAAASADLDSEISFAALDPAPVLAVEDQPVLEKSPSGSLFATVLPDDSDEEGEEAMPPLDLDSALAVDVSPPLYLEPRVGLSLGKEEEELQQASEEEDLEEQEVTPKPTPASVKAELPMLTVDIPVVDFAAPVPVIIVQDAPEKLDLEVEAESEPVTALESFPDPDLLPLPASPLTEPVLEAIPALQPPAKDDSDSDADGAKAAPRQTPTPPASPPPISPLRFNPGSKSRPPSPAALSAKLRLPPSPRLALVVPLTTTRPAQDEDKDNETPTALTASSASSSSKRVWGKEGGGDAEVEEVISRSAMSLSSPGLRKRVLVDVDSGAEKARTAEEAEVRQGEDEMSEEEPRRPEVHATGLKLSSSLPGSFPEPAPIISKSTSTSSTSSLASSSNTSTSTPTIAARLALAPAVLTPRPSARALARSPLDIALAMQLRPGLGAGADPAWMVRFLMAMFGWLAVVVSGGEQF